MKKLSTAILFLSIWLSSCTHYYYVPNTQNVPLFKEKNELHLTGAFGGGENSSGSEIQAAYSFPMNIGIMTNFISAKGNDNTGENWGKGTYIDGAIGYYRPIGNIGVMEIYGGVGGSNQKHQYSITELGPDWVTYHTPTGTSDVSFTKLFLQPSFGLTFSGFDFAFSTRVSRLSFNKIDNQINKLKDTEEYDRLNAIALREKYFFLEPALTVRGGWKYIKVQFQVGTTSYMKDPDINFEDYHFSLGFYITFADRFRKEAKLNAK